MGQVAARNGRHKALSAQGVDQPVISHGQSAAAVHFSCGWINGGYLFAGEQENALLQMDRAFIEKWNLWMSGLDAEETPPEDGEESD